MEDTVVGFNPSSPSPPDSGSESEYEMDHSSELNTPKKKVKLTRPSLATVPSAAAAVSAAATAAAAAASPVCVPRKAASKLSKSKKNKRKHSPSPPSESVTSRPAKSPKLSHPSVSSKLVDAAAGARGNAPGHGSKKHHSKQSRPVKSLANATNDHSDILAAATANINKCSAVEDYDFDINLLTPEEDDSGNVSDDDDDDEDDDDDDDGSGPKTLAPLPIPSVTPMNESTLAAPVASMPVVTAAAPTSIPTDPVMSKCPSPHCFHEMGIRTSEANASYLHREMEELLERSRTSTRNADDNYLQTAHTIQLYSTTNAAVGKTANINMILTKTGRSFRNIFINSCVEKALPFAMPGRVAEGVLMNLIDQLGRGTGQDGQFHPPASSTTVNNVVISYECGAIVLSKQTKEGYPHSSSRLNFASAGNLRGELTTCLLIMRHYLNPPRIRAVVNSWIQATFAKCTCILSRRDLKLILLSHYYTLNFNPLPPARHVVQDLLNYFTQEF